VRVNRATQVRESAFYGGSWESLEAQRHLCNLTTNQKVAGSSPVERAVISITRRGFMGSYEGLSSRGDKKNPFKRGLWGSCRTWIRTRTN
jgi:hypothetical protein